MKKTLCGFNDAMGVLAGDMLVTHGPTLLVDIGFDITFDHINPSLAPKLAETKLWALVDTGATESCIDDDLAQRLELPIVDRREIAGVSGRKTVNMCLAHIHVSSLSYTIYGSFSGVNLIAGGQRHYALIGRTFLKDFVMRYNGITGNVELELP